MVICTATNSHYTRYCMVMLTSLFENNRNQELELYILHRDLIDRDMFCLQNAASKYGKQLNFVYVDCSAFQDFPVSGRIPLESYFRLKIPDLLPALVERVLYLDVDLIVRGSLVPLFEADLHGKAFGACLDYPYEERLTGSRKNLFGREEDLRYFNAGVMLWDLAAIRQRYPFDMFLQAAEKLGKQMIYHDQDILNYLCSQDVQYLNDRKFNYLKERYFDPPERAYAAQALIIHYSGCSPWQLGAKNALYKEWWSYAKRTPFYQELMEEQLQRTEEAVSAYVERKHEETIAVFRSFYELKGTGAAAQKMRTCPPYGLYGAGQMAEWFWEFLEGEGAGIPPAAVIDRGKGGGLFHGTPIASNLASAERAGVGLLIVTPAGNASSLIREIRNTAAKNIRVISLRAFLEEIPRENHPVGGPGLDFISR